MTIKLAVIPGDGIGPEVIQSGISIIKRLEEITSLKVHLEYFPHGADHYLKTQETLSQKTLDELQKYDAIYFGAIGDPRVKPGILEQGIILKLRFHFDLYVNLRPIKLFLPQFSPLKKDVPIDMVVIRENTEGLYCGAGGFLKKETVHEVATQEMINTYLGVERIIRYAFDFAEKMGRKKVTLCDKANVLTYSHDLWQRVFHQLKSNYDSIESDHSYVDAMTMKMVRNPENLDVIVTCNLFGDIITDLGAELQGGMGMAASANIHPGRLGLYEPVHGSAPDIAGKDLANPIAAILALSLLLREHSYQDEGDRIERAVMTSLEEGDIPVAMGGTLKCQSMTQAILERLS